jgi:hypothetical protein
LFISFACPKETNQRKRPQQSQLQIFFLRYASPATPGKFAVRTFVGSSARRIFAATLK